MAARIVGTAELESVASGTTFLALSHFTELTLPSAMKPRAVNSLEALSQAALAKEATLALDWLRR